MGTGPEQHDRGLRARWVSLDVADDPEAWSAAGFAVEDDTVRLGDTVIRLTGSAPTGSVPGRRGVRSAVIEGLDLPTGHLDGLVVTGGSTVAGGPCVSGTGRPHPNGVTGIDHIVVLTPDLDRTIDALTATGLVLRRIRPTDSYGTPMRQAFFRIGSVILEVVGTEPGTGEPAEDAPAGWFGLALAVADLDALSRTLGPALGSIRDAVQEGRRIATVRGRQLGISVALALMDTHPDRRT